MQQYILKCISITFLVSLLNILYAQQETFYNQTFFDDFNSTELNKTDWRVATWKEHGGQTGTERCFTKDGCLNLLFVNDSAQGFLNASIESKKEFLFGRWEARLKPSDVPGVLNSFFTIDWDNTTLSSATNDGTKQEIDIEFLTYSFGDNRGTVHYAVHMEGKESFETNPDVVLSFNPSKDFHVWGFEITPEHIQWFVDSVVLKRYIYKENAFPITAPYQLKLNTWSAQKWINGPPAKNVTCTYLIDWIRFTPYGTNKSNPQNRKTGMNFKIIRDPSDQRFNFLGQMVDLGEQFGIRYLLIERTAEYYEDTRKNRFNQRLVGFSLCK